VKADCCNREPPGKRYTKGEALEIIRKTVTPMRDAGMSWDYIELLMGKGTMSAYCGAVTEDVCKKFGMNNVIL
jgi:hypothetical protein